MLNLTKRKVGVHIHDYADVAPRRKHADLREVSAAVRWPASK